ncbi:hypothetical protein C5S29_01985, partial [ANME-1 cluster archaeon GoMg3.2]|nr:hypothetical protein [ANME-1 cluster archaeon GoMg3.2]
MSNRKNQTFLGAISFSEVIPKTLESH